MDSHLPGQILDLVDFDMRASVMSPYHIWAPQLVDLEYNCQLPLGAERYIVEIEFKNETERLYPWQIKEAAKAISCHITKQVRQAGEKEEERNKLLYLTEKPYLTVTTGYSSPERLWLIRVSALAYTFPVCNYTVIQGASNETE